MIFSDISKEADTSKKGASILSSKFDGMSNNKIGVGPATPATQANHAAGQALINQCFEFKKNDS